ncbi:MAG TPA: tetratricopeptide repeat protein [Burkholderiaceae bacterium]|nr:tetratricopeptide repeat protein [Burkholderiaceae bacterium]
MATPLDLQEQEQLDQIKAFWNQYGHLITWTVTLALAGFAAWNGWNWWQRSQATKAAALFDELDRVAQAGDVERAGRAFGDLKERFPRTLQAQQAALLAAKVQADKGQPDAALTTLAWAADNAGEDEYRTLARLRAAGLLMDKKQYDEALKQLDAAQQGKPREFDALIADRRGDVLAAQGKKAEALTAYQAAYKAMDSKADYRRLLEAKLTALGAAPEAAASAPAAAVAGSVK